MSPSKFTPRHQGHKPRVGWAWAEGEVRVGGLHSTTSQKVGLPASMIAQKGGLSASTVGLPASTVGQQSSPLTKLIEEQTKKERTVSTHTCSSERAFLICVVDSFLLLFFRGAL